VSYARGWGIACITPPSGVQLLDARSYSWTNNPPLLDAATSVAESLNRNLVAQTKDSIQIFSLDVLKSGEVRNDVRPSHVYPLDDRHIACLLQPTRRLALLELETLRELRPNNDASPLQWLLKNQSPSARAPFSRGPVAKFGVEVVIQAWRSGTPLPVWTKAADDLEMGEAYDVTFDSQTRSHLKLAGSGQHVQFPNDIIASPSGSHSHTMTDGEPLLSSEAQETPPYSLDADCEWVVDAEFRKICWISPGNVRRGDGGHFWAGLSLVMVGDDGVVRKLTFREPDS
jgi:hypothetical protein